MKHWIIILAPLLLVMPRSPAPQTPVPQTKAAIGSSSSADYKLVWADEFNTNGHLMRATGHSNKVLCGTENNNGINLRMHRVRTGCW